MSTYSKRGSALAAAAILSTVAATGFAPSSALAAQSTASSTATTQASSVAQNDPAIQELRETLQDRGLSDSQVANLLSKLERGEKWDSFSGKKPVKTETRSEFGETVVDETFADGSFATSSTTLPTTKSDTTTRSVSNCSRSVKGSTVTFSNCYANVDLGIIQMGFSFNWQVVGRTAKITKSWGMNHRVIGAAFDHDRLETYGSRTTRYSTDLSLAFKGFPLGWTAWMQVTVNGSHATTSHN